MEFDGLVEIPEGISLDEFEAWAAITTEDPSQLAVEELSLALQVSDKLSAHNTTQLAAALAAKLKATDWRSAVAKEAVMYALLSLGKNMQHLVFREAGKLSAPAVFSWPMVLQQVYSDLWVIPSQGGKPCPFTIAGDHPPASVLGFLNLLSRTDPALPGLSSLSLHCAIPTAESANLLCSVLLHHSNLAALRMPLLSCAPNCPSSPAATVFHTLRQLTAITSLTLSAPCLPATPTDAVMEATAEAVQAMAAAISALPRLSHFDLSTAPIAPAQHSGNNGSSRRRAPTAGPPLAPKRRRFTACMGPGTGTATPPSLDPVIAALSTAPALTALKFGVSRASLGRPLPCSGMLGPFRTLQRLMFETSNSTDAGGDDVPPPGMELLDTSRVCLPALTRLQYTNTSQDCYDDCGSVRRMLAAAALHPALEYMVVRLGKPLPEGDMTGAFWLNVYTKDPHRQEGSGKEVSLSFERLMSEKVSKVLQSSVPGLAASASSVILHLNSDDKEVSGRELVGVEHAAPIVPLVATFTSLQVLTVALWLRGSAGKALCSTFLAQSLQALRMLTILRIEMSAELCMPLSMVAKQLQGMGQLRVLSIAGFTHAGAHEFEACFATLTALTDFQVGVRPVTADLVRAWARAACAMPQLHASRLSSCDGPKMNPALDSDGHADADWCRGLLELPSWGRYTIDFIGDTPEGELEVSVWQQLLDRGAEVDEYLDYVYFEKEHASDRHTSSAEFS